MGGKHSRDKGARGEREFFAKLSELLGFEIKRSLSASRDGGADGLELDGWAIEVKRQESNNVKVWFKQAIDQAKQREKDTGFPCRPALAMRKNRQPSWSVAVLLHDLNPDVYPCDHYKYAIIDIDDFVILYWAVFDKLMRE